MNTARFGRLYASALAVSLLAAPMIVAPVQNAEAQFGIGLSITVAPPELPIYEQPPLPEPGYMWTPGYWAYGDEGYFWVPGTWVQPPSEGLLWTPGYWGWNNGIYAFNQGYWGAQVGFYGGINYGFGYGGFGYQGGEWRNGAFAYNRAVNNFGGVRVANVYERNVVVNNTRNVSFNGPNGITARPTAAEEAAARVPHVQPTPLQLQHRQMAAQNRQLLASVNHGHPAIAATARPAAFSGPGVVPARGNAVEHGPIIHEAPAAHAGPAGGMARPGFGAPRAAVVAHPVVAHPGVTHPGYAAPSHPVYHPAYHPAPHPVAEHMAAPVHVAPAPRPMPVHVAPRPAPAPHPAPAPEKKPH